MHVFVAHCNFAGTWRVVEYQPGSRPRSHELVDAGFRHADLPSCLPLLPSCLFTRHLWLKEGGKNSICESLSQCCPRPKPLFSPSDRHCTSLTLLSPASRPRVAKGRVQCFFYYLLSAPPCARLARTLSPSTPTLTPTHHPPRESGSGVDKRGCFERPPQQTKDIPWPPNSQPHLLHPRADCNETPTGPHTTRPSRTLAAPPPFFIASHDTLPPS